MYSPAWHGPPPATVLPWGHLSAMDTLNSAMGFLTNRSVTLVRYVVELNVTTMTIQLDRSSGMSVVSPTTATQTVFLLPSGGSSPLTAFKTPNPVSSRKEDAVLLGSVCGAFVAGGAITAAVMIIWRNRFSKRPSAVRSNLPLGGSEVVPTDTVGRVPGDEESVLDISSTEADPGIPSDTYVEPDTSLPALGTPPKRYVAHSVHNQPTTPSGRDRSSASAAPKSGRSDLDPPPSYRE